MAKTTPTTAQNILDLCTALNTESREYMKPRLKKWVKLNKYYHNDTISQNRPAYKSRSRMNYCYVIPSCKVPIITQGTPTVTFTPLDDRDEALEAGKKASRLVGGYIFPGQKMQAKFIDLMTLACTFDVAYLKVWYDAATDEIKIEVIAPQNLLVDPAAQSEDDARFAIHHSIRPLAVVKSMFPTIADKIEANGDVSLSETDTGFDDDDSRIQITGTNVKYIVERATVKEFWLSPVLFTGTKDEGHYPYGRFVTIINDTLVADDKDSPYTHGKMPYVRYVSNKVPANWFGLGDLEQILPLQDQLNLQLQQLDDWVSRSTNLGATIDPSAGIKAIKSFQTTLGIPGALRIAPVGKFQWDSPAMIPSIVLRRISDTCRYIEQVSGITEILMGIAPSRQRTWRGLERIWDAATSRIGLTRKNFEESTKRLAELCLATAQQFWTKKDIRIIGNTGKLESFVFSPADCDFSFDCSIDSGASLPQDKASRVDLALNLLQQGVVSMALSPDPKQNLVAKWIMKDLLQMQGADQLLNYNDTQATAPPAGQGTQPDERVTALAQTMGVDPQQLLARIQQQSA